MVVRDDGAIVASKCDTAGTNGTVFFFFVSQCVGFLSTRKTAYRMQKNRAPLRVFALAISLGWVEERGMVL